MTGQNNDFPFSVFPTDQNLDVLDHELGNVLNGLLGMAELLSGSGLNTEQNRWLRAIEHSGRQMQLLIRSLQFSGGREGPESVLRKIRVDGLDMLEQVLTAHTPAARLSNNQLLLVIDPDLPRYWHCDPCLVRQLLDNLVGNAIKFTKAGEIVVEVSAAGPEGTPDYPLYFSVSDTGPGFDEEAQTRIFGAYQRACVPGVSEPVGRGLGLFICRTLVKSMGGRISCANQAGDGARFEIVLPGTLVAPGVPSPLPHSLLFSQIHCHLVLTGELLRSVENFLGRLGVSSSRESSCSSGYPVSNYPFSLEISTAARPFDGDSEGLLRVSGKHQDSQVRSKVLHTPLLQSSLAATLLEAVFEGRCASVRNDKPDSTRQPC